MLVNPKIIDRAKEKLRKMQEEREYLNLCAKAEICYLCGRDTDLVPVTGNYSQMAWSCSACGIVRLQQHLRKESKKGEK